MARAGREENRSFVTSCDDGRDTLSIIQFHHREVISLFKKFLVIAITVIGMGCFASQALAAGSNTNTTPAQLTNENIAYSGVSLSSKQTVSIAAKEDGKLEIKAQMPGLEQKLEKDVTPQQQKVINGHRLGVIIHVHGYACEWMIAIWGASQTSSGKTVWIAKPGNHGLTFACRVGGVWRQILGPPSQWNCGNQVVPIHQTLPKRAVVYRGKYVIVTHFTFTAKVRVTAHVSARLSATATCTSAGASASATGNVSGSASTVLTFSANGSTKAQAMAKAASKVKVSVSQTATLQGEAKANAQIKLNAAAWATCLPSTPTPTPPATCTDTNATNYGSALPCTYSCPTGDTGTYPNCVVPVTPTIAITAYTQLNQIPAGESSTNFDITVNASQSGGSLTVDGGIGSVSTCDSTTPQNQVVFTNLPAGSTTECVTVYAPNDSDQPTSMTVTMTANLGSASDMKSDTFAITYPTRPS